MKSRNETQLLLEGTRRGRAGAFYEIHPDLTLRKADAPASDWFEIALHVEVDEHRPHGHASTREAFETLIGLADLLIQRVKCQAPYRLEMPASYYTLHGEGHRRPLRKALTISLTFSDVGPYSNVEEPALLKQLKAELALLGVAPSGVNLQPWPPGSSSPPR